MIPQRASLVAFHRGEGFEFHVDVGVAAHIDSNVADRATGEGEGRLVDRRGDRPQDLGMFYPHDRNLILYLGEQF